MAQVGGPVKGKAGSGFARREQRPELRRVWVCTGGALPGFPACRPPGIHLTVEVALAHLGEELPQRHLLPPKRNSNDLALRYREVHHGAFPHLRVLCEWLGNPQRETVAPLFHRDTHCRSTPWSIYKEDTPRGAPRDRKSTRLNS